LKSSRSFANFIRVSNESPFLPFLLNSTIPKTSSLLPRYSPSLSPPLTLVPLSRSPAFPATADQTEFANLLPYPDELAEIVRPRLAVFPFSTFDFTASDPFDEGVGLLALEEEVDEGDEEEVAEERGFSIPPFLRGLRVELVALDDLESREEERFVRFMMLIDGSETLIVEDEAREEDLERVKDAEVSTSSRAGSESIDVSGVVEGSDELNSVDPLEE